MRPAHRLDFADVGKLLVPETGSKCRNGEDLEAQTGPGCAQHGQQGPTESEESPDRAGQASWTREEQRPSPHHGKQRGIWIMFCLLRSCAVTSKTWSWDRFPAHRPLSCGFTHPLKATYVLFGSFGMLHGDKALWFELMRGGAGMPQLEVHDKQGAGAEVEPRVGTD